MSILKGGASTDTYSLEFVEGRGYDRFVDVNEIFFSSVWNSVTVFQLQSQNLIINDRDLVSFFNVYDVNGDFIGFYSKQEYDYQSTGSTWLGDITTNMTLHPNSYFVAFNSATVTTTNWGPAVSFSQFQTLTVSYDTNPAIDNIYYGTTTIDRVYAGGTLVFGTPPFGAYELIADVEVTSNTTQIDFDNLNITKDDELRLVYTLNNNYSGENFIRLIANNFTNTSDYYFQDLIGNGSSLTSNRSNFNELCQVGQNKSVNGFVDIKISNNNKYVFQSQFIYNVGSNSSLIQNVNHNVVGQAFTLTTLTNLSFVSVFSNGIGVGSRLQLYKVNTGSA